MATGEKHLKRIAVFDEEIVLYEHGNGPALVLIHGMFGDHLDWEPVLEPLSRNHRVIALDLPGFGDSTKPKVEYTGQFFVAQMHALLRQLKIEKVTFVGNSFGCIIALLYALEYPREVSAMVLIGSGALHKWTEEEKQQALARFSEANLQLLNPTINQMLFSPLFVNPGSDIATKYIEKQNAKLFRADFPGYVHSLHSSMNLGLDAYLVDSLPRIAVPTLLLQGKKDQVIQLAWVEAAAANFPAAKLQILPESGHVPQLECPDQVVAAVETFTSANR